MLVMVLALGFLFAACNQVQEVTGAVEVTAPKASAVSGVTARATSTGNYIILKWIMTMLTNGRREYLLTVIPAFSLVRKSSLGCEPYRW